jgi:hypothetical protein
VIGRAHHLAEDRLLDCYVAERSNEALDPPAAEHLADCVDCRGRYAELSCFMDGLRDDADSDTDDLFPADWRDVQRQNILRRVENLGHAARVISFPGRLVSPHMSRGARLRVSPWAAATAAASLFLGVAVGMFYDGRTAPSTVAVVRSAQPPAVQATAGLAPVALDTDAFLSELERALNGPQTPELQSLDVLTPHVREIAFDVR